MSVDGRGASAARAVPRHRHAEPDRVRGHLSAARGAARPLPAARRARLPERRARARDARRCRARASRRAALGDVRPVVGAEELAGARRADRRRRPSPTRSRGYVVDARAPHARAAERRARRLAARRRASARRRQGGRAPRPGARFVTPDDVAEIAPAALAHRLVLTPEAELERFTAREAVAAAHRRRAGAPLSDGAAPTRAAGDPGRASRSPRCSSRSGSRCGARGRALAAAGADAWLVRDAPRRGAPARRPSSRAARRSTLRVDAAHARRPARPAPPAGDRRRSRVERRDGARRRWLRRSTARRRGRHELPGVASASLGPLGLARVATTPAPSRAESPCTPTSSRARR